jgi:integrase
MTTQSQKQRGQVKQDEWPRKVVFGNATVTVYRRTFKVKRQDGDGKPLPDGEHTQFLVANYSGEGGKRRLDSYKTEQLALDAADTLAKRLSKRDAIGAAMTRDDSQQFAVASQELMPHGVSLSAAATVICQAIKITGSIDAIIPALKFWKQHHRNITSKTVADASTEFLKVKESRGASERYKKDLRLRLDKFSETFKGNVGDVTTDLIQAWFDKQGYAGQTYLNNRTVLNTFFEFCTARKYCYSNPIEEVERVKANGGDIEIYTPVEIARLLAASDAEFLPVLALAAFCGLRSAEIERLEWKDLNFQKRFVELGKSKAKTRSRRLVPISDNLAAWLQPYSRKEGKIWPHSSVLLYRRMQQTAAATEVLNDSEKKIKHQPAIAWKQNALRHSFISYRMAETNDAAKVSLEAGNSPAMVFKHYRQLVTEEQAKAWFGVLPNQADNVTTLPAAAS